MTEKRVSKPSVAILQRAIAHYRFPLFQKLAQTSAYDWTFFCGDHDQQISTGLPSLELHRLPIRPIRNRKVVGPFDYQSGFRVRGFDVIMLDLGWTLLSNPRYLMEARLRGIATIGWSKGIPQNLDQHDGMAKRAYQKFIIDLCDAVVLYGNISQEFFLKLGYPQERLFVARNTVDTIRISQDIPVALAQKQRILQALPLQGRFVFGYLGGLIDRKKVESVIAAFSALRARGTDAVLVIAGSGPSRSTVEAAVSASQFYRDIYLVGRVPVGEEGGWFQLFDAYLSFAQGGLGILEAMAHGKVVVSTPEIFPETELLVDGETGLLSLDCSESTFVECMERAVAYRDQLAPMGRRAQQCVLAKATLENMVASIDNAVACAVGGRGKAHFVV